MADKRRALGRGIGALIPDNQSEQRNSPIDVFFSTTSNDVPVVQEVQSLEGAGKNDESVTSEHKTRRNEAKAPRNGAGTTATPEVQREANQDSEKAAKKTSPKKSRANVSRETSATIDNPTHGEVSHRDDHTTSAEELVPVPGATFGEIPVQHIVPNMKQPRQIFDEDELQELADSIKEVGVLQPIVVRPLTAPLPDAPAARYELVMGERRWRATQLAGLDVVPAIVRRTQDFDLLRDALLENLHRAQLNALEEAAAYQQLLDEFNCTQEELSKRIARSRPQISNTLRLLKLPPLVQRRVAAGVLSAGHARALLGLADAASMERLAQRIVAEGLSVRATEEIVALGDEPVETKRRRVRNEADPELMALASRLGEKFDTKVRVTMGARKGRITIDFGSLDDLDRIVDLLG